MLTEFKYIGISFQKADLLLRESILINEKKCKELIRSVKEFWGCNETIIVDLGEMVEDAAKN